MFWSSLPLCLNWRVFHVLILEQPVWASRANDSCRKFQRILSEFISLVLLLMAPDYNDLVHSRFVLSESFTAAHISFKQQFVRVSKLTNLFESVYNVNGPFLTDRLSTTCYLFVSTKEYAWKHTLMNWHLYSPALLFIMGPTGMNVRWVQWQHAWNTCFLI